MNSQESRVLSSGRCLPHPGILASSKGRRAVLCRRPMHTISLCPAWLEQLSVSGVLGFPYTSKWTPPRDLPVPFWLPCRSNRRQPWTDFHEQTWTPNLKCRPWLELSDSMVRSTSSTSSPSSWYTAESAPCRALAHFFSSRMNASLLDVLANSMIPSKKLLIAYLSLPILSHNNDYTVCMKAET